MCVCGVCIVFVISLIRKRLFAAPRESREYRFYVCSLYMCVRRMYICMYMYVHLFLTCSNEFRMLNFFEAKTFYFNWLLQIIDWLNVDDAAAAAERLANCQNFTE